MPSFAAIARPITTALLDVPSVIEAINTWSAATHDDTVLYPDYRHSRLVNVRLNTRYRLTGGGYVLSWRYPPGYGTLWVERWDEAPTGLIKTDSKRFALDHRVRL